MPKTYEELEAEMLKQMESEEAGQPAAAVEAPIQPEAAVETAPIQPEAQPEAAKETPPPAETVPEEEPLDLDPPIEHLARRRLAQEQAAAAERQRAADKELADLRAEVARLKQPKAEAKPDPLGDEFFKALADAEGEGVADALRKVYAAIQQQAAPAQGAVAAAVPAPATAEIPQQEQVDTYIADTVASHPDLSYWHELYVKAEESKTLSSAEKARMQRPFLLAVKASNELAADRKSGLVDPLLGHWTAKPNELAGAIVSRVRQLNTPRSAAPATATTPTSSVSPPPRSLDDVGGGSTGSVATKSRAQQAVELYQSGKDDEAEALLTNDKDRMQFNRMVFGGTGGAQ
jgi:hypothetical protein